MSITMLHVDNRSKGLLIVDPINLYVSFNNQSNLVRLMSYLTYTLLKTLIYTAKVLFV